MIIFHSRIMPTEEDLKAIVVHKKYSSSRKSKSDGRKRKRSTSSGSSNSSISSASTFFSSYIYNYFESLQFNSWTVNLNYSNTQISHFSDERKPEKPENKDAGFIPSRFLKDKHRSSSRRRDEEPAHPAYKDRRDSLKKYTTFLEINIYSCRQMSDHVLQKIPYFQMNIVVYIYWFLEEKIVVRKEEKIGLVRIGHVMIDEMIGIGHDIMRRMIGVEIEASDVMSTWYYSICHLGTTSTTMADLLTIWEVYQNS